MKTKLLALSLVSVCMLSVAGEGNEFGPLVTSFGAPDCGTWVNAPNPATRAWLMGFMSGKNNMWVAKPKDPLDQLTSGNQMIVWMDNWCRANPLKNVSDGGNVLWNELVRQAQRRQSQ